MAESRMPGVQTEKQKQEEQNARLFEAQNLGNVTSPEERDFRLPTSLTASRRLYYKASNALLDAKSSLQSNLIYEIETGLGFNLVPVFLGSGVLIYFTIPQEPSLIALLLSILVLMFFSHKSAFLNKVRYTTNILLLIFAGILVGKVTTLSGATPQLERQVTGQVTGIVLGVDQSRRGAARYLVKPFILEGVVETKLPKRLRISAAAKHNNFSPGETITGLARLQPISGPVYPGGYDFSFFAWHEGMGGSGFFMGKPHKGSTNGLLDLREQGLVLINKMRIAVERRILDAMPGVSGKIAIALVTGNKTHIPNDIQESLRKTGLAHILAISGLHMALVTLTVIWCVRYSLSSIPQLPLYYPVKKWAVIAGFISATVYLMLSGAGIATQRAWIMISVMLMAILMDRRAITMRSVAISATLILLINPQSLFSPGFQMSFAAVTALVAGYEALNNRRQSQLENKFIPAHQNRFITMVRGLVGYFAGIATTSLIAGTATAFIAAWHFHQVAPLGLLANLIAMPVVSIVIMPFALFSILLMPYGLEFLPLSLVSTGIEWVVEISRWVENLSPRGDTGLLPVSAMFLFSIFLICICVLKTRLRFLAVLPLALIVFVLEKPRMPDVIVAENGRAIAIRTEENQLGLLFPGSSRFVQDIWLKAWSGGTSVNLNLNKEQCNRERCIVVLPSSRIMHIVYNPDHIQSSCGRADLLIAPRLWWVNCKTRKPELVLARYDFERFGTHALYISQVNPNAKSERAKLISEILIETGLPEARRPWQRRVTHPDDANLFSKNQ